MTVFPHGSRHPAGIALPARPWKTWVLRIVIGTATLIFLFVVAVLFNPLLIEAAFHLFAGWAISLWRIFGHGMRGGTLVTGCSILFVIAAAVGGLTFLRMRLHPGGAWQGRHAGMTFALAALAILASMALGGIWRQAGGLVSEDTIVNRSRKTLRSIMRDESRNLACLLLSHADEHGKYPQSIQELANDDTMGWIPGIQLHRWVLLRPGQPALEDRSRPVAVSEVQTDGSDPWIVVIREDGSIKIQPAGDLDVILDGARRD